MDPDSAETNNRITILSSTDFMQDKVISQQSKSLYATSMGQQAKSRTSSPKFMRETPNGSILSQAASMVATR